MSLPQYFLQLKSEQQLFQPQLIFNYQTPISAYMYSQQVHMSLIPSDIVALEE